MGESSRCVARNWGIEEESRGSPTVLFQVTSYTDSGSWGTEWVRDW